MRCLRIISRKLSQIDPSLLWNTIEVGNADSIAAFRSLQKNETTISPERRYSAAEYLLSGDIVVSNTKFVQILILHLS